MKKTTTTGTGTVNNLREYKTEEKKFIEEDFINGCFRPNTNWSWRDIKINPILVALLIVMISATCLFILYDRQMAIVEDLHSTVDQMVDIQKETIAWVSDIEEMAIDNHLRLVELEGK